MDAAPQASGYWLRERWPDGEILNDLGADVIYDRDRTEFVVTTTIFFLPLQSDTCHLPLCSAP